MFRTTIAIAMVLGLGCHDRDGAEPSPTGAPTPPVAPPSTAGAGDGSTPPASVVDAAPAAPVDATLTTDAATKVAQRVGRHGDVCAIVDVPRSVDDDDDPYATGSPRKVTPRKCGPDLVCCHGGGVQGRHSVCETRGECQRDMQVPRAR
jgi:hypothetical protein